MASSILKRSVLFFCFSMFSMEIFGKETCATHTDFYQQSTERLHYANAVIRSELVNNDKRLMILDRLQGQLFEYPNVLIKSPNPSANRSKSELLEAIRLSRESSLKLESLLKEIQVLSYLNRKCSPINQSGQ